MAAAHAGATARHPHKATRPILKVKPELRSHVEARLWALKNGRTFGEASHG